MRPRAKEPVKESKQLTQSRKDAKKRKDEVLSLLCDLCVFAPWRETGLSFLELFRTLLTVDSLVASLWT